MKKLHFIHSYNETIQPATLEKSIKCQMGGFEWFRKQNLKTDLQIFKNLLIEFV